MIWENVVGPFLVHTLLGSQPLSSPLFQYIPSGNPPPSLLMHPWGGPIGRGGGGGGWGRGGTASDATGGAGEEGPPPLGACRPKGGGGGHILRGGLIEPHGRCGLSVVGGRSGMY